MPPYHLKKSDAEPGEFEVGTTVDQRVVPEKSGNLVREKPGFPFAAFGPHGRGTNDATDAALGNPIFVTDPPAFPSACHQKGADREGLVLSGHSNPQDEKHGAVLPGIMAFLQSKGAVIMTPPELLMQKENAGES